MSDWQTRLPPKPPFEPSGSVADHEAAANPHTQYVRSIVAGSGVAIDDADPQNPVVSASGFPEGDVFPTVPAPVANDKFYRTDLNLLCFYDGTRWLSCDVFSLNTSCSDAEINITSNKVIGRIAPREDLGTWMEKVTFLLRPTVTNNGANYWTCGLFWNNSTDAGTFIQSANTSAIAAGVIMRETKTIGAELNSNARLFSIFASKNGSPGPLGISAATIYYRLIVT